MKIKKFHPWDVTPVEAVRIQEELRREYREEFPEGGIGLMAGADASYSRHEKVVHGAVCILTFPDMEVIETRCASLPTPFPYIPGLLTFREGPVLIECFRMIENIPDIVLFDGQGIAHPRGMGIATHLGILLDLPSIGCAKTRLFGDFEEPSLKRGAWTPLKGGEGEVLGVCLRTREGVKPVFISPGHRMDAGGALETVLSCTGCFRIPEPLRRAHSLAQGAI